MELQHLNPIGVLHIIIFVTVCEAFLRMEPHVDFFHHFFSEQALSEGDPPRTVLVGGFVL